ncbi:hypothetical protein J0X19_12165 [Hymenobacter sp. BT186]|uniref:Uncharacterized protein n=1 Tax=Hymenobacter telluris TaxID=2816474 RepID=A0A939J9D8_9BACT|nr:DUF6348 family protein [Hymenobacter telluris]MBO0358704.1 hypothetical protein [Hymenobacter telluris]MBW3374730.1 hypothetical protein [Hymenobacter norwichensis]
MNLLKKLRQKFLSNAPAASDVTHPESEVPTLDNVLHKQILTHLTALFPSLQIEKQGDEFILKPYRLILQASVVERTEHPTAIVLALGMWLRHAEYFPEAMMECLAGIGENDFDAIDRGVQNYLHSVLPVVIEALEGYHIPDLDIVSATNEVLWHPIVSELQLQGAWARQIDQTDDRHFLTLLKPFLLQHLTPQPIHWLKVYASKLPDGEFIGECLLNNEPWPEGLALIQDNTEAWPTGGDFAGQKQFIIFRRCGP